MLLLGLLGCRSSSPGRRPTYRGLFSEPTGSWFGTTFGVVDRADGDLLRDGLTLGLTVGQDLSGGSVRPSFELLLESSRHRRRTDNETLALWRVGFGARLSADWEQMRATPYVQGGIFHREAETDDDEDPDREFLDGSGAYAGVGLLFWTARGSIGPFARVYRDEEDREEWAYGFAGSIYY